MDLMNLRSNRAAREDRLELQRFVPYLLNFVGGRWVSAFAPRAKQFDINYSTWRVLMTLWYCGALHLVEIADRANFDLSTLFRIVADLESRKLLQRANHKRRGRTYAVGLSAAGIKIVRRLLPIALEHEQILLSGLSDGEQLMLIELLNRLSQTVANNSRTAQGAASHPISAKGSARSFAARHFRTQVDHPSAAGNDRVRHPRAMASRKTKAPTRRVR
jgi:DNA-binding MarR family transcriptional regulator